MGLPAKHERYPEVTRICQVIPNSAAKQRFLWALTETLQLRSSLGELCGTWGGSFLMLKVKFLLLSLTWWAQSSVSWVQFASLWVFPWALASVTGLYCLLAGDRGQVLPLIYTLMQRIGTKWNLRKTARQGTWDRGNLLGPLPYNYPCIITTKKIPLWKLGCRGGNIHAQVIKQLARSKSQTWTSIILLNPGSHHGCGD